MTIEQIESRMATIAQMVNGINELRTDLLYEESRYLTEIKVLNSQTKYARAYLEDIRMELLSLKGKKDWDAYMDAKKAEKANK